MNYIIKKYWLVIRFILVFLITYSVLTVAYKIYLDQSDGSIYYPDYFTNLVGHQCKDLLISINYPTQMIPHPEELSLMMIVKDKYVARIVEGCNAISIIILFISFILAFYNGFKRTVLFILGGSVLIYVANLIRVALLGIGLYHYPWRREFLHSVVFPLIIYGMVFLLWMFWIHHFTKSQQALENNS